MKLVIDKGNTRTKIAVFKGADMLFLNAVKALDMPLICELFSKYDIKNTIFSTVSGKEKEDIINNLSTHSNLFMMSEDLYLPIQMNYLPKYTLGNDRIAAIVGATEIFPKKSVLVIDAGSCICVDFVNDKSEYKGGSISLGFEMKSKALNTFTASLPLIDLDNQKVAVCSNNTTDCIKSGIVNGTIFEIQGMIEYYAKQENNEFKIILTGGDAEFISKNIEYDNIVEENLVLKGLNTILEYNINKRNV